MNKAVDNNRNGVVGSNGTKIPRIPRPREIRPSVASINLRILFFGCVISFFTNYSFLSIPFFAFAMLPKFLINASYTIKFLMIE